MQVSLAFMAVVIIWSTTPLAIHWSNTSLGFVTALSLRMVLAALLGFVVLKVAGKRLVQKPSDRLNFMAGGLGLFPTMFLVYWAAQTVPSGVMSVVFGLFPFFAGVWSWLLMGQNTFTPLKITALLLAVVGLVLMNLGQLQIGIEGVWGMLAIVLATALWALSSVWLKSLPNVVDPFRQTVGSVVLVAPAFFGVFWFFGQNPFYTDVSLSATLALIDMRSWVGVGYLVLAGSLLGHTIFFYVLTHCRVTTVALMPLIAPVIALTLGWWVEGEIIGPVKLMGAAVLLLALGLYQGVFHALWRLNCWRPRPE